MPTCSLFCVSCDFVVFCMFVEGDPRPAERPRPVLAGRRSRAGTGRAAASVTQHGRIFTAADRPEGQGQRGTDTHTQPLLLASLNTQLKLCGAYLGLCFSLQDVQGHRWRSNIEANKISAIYPGSSRYQLLLVNNSVTFSYCDGCSRSLVFQTMSHSVSEILNEFVISVSKWI